MNKIESKSRDGEIRTSRETTERNDFFGDFSLNNIFLFYTLAYLDKGNIYILNKILINSVKNLILSKSFIESNRKYLHINIDENVSWLRPSLRATLLLEATDDF